jgi:hypothetical protein
MRLRWENLDDRTALQSVHVLYISRSESARLGRILAYLRNLPILVVGDSENFAARGGTIGFALNKKRIAFEISRKAADQSGVRISARLMKLATVVD